MHAQTDEPAPSRPAHLLSMQSYLTKPDRLVLGLHSGTSADGPTAALVRVTGATETARVELLASRTYEYPPELRRGLLQVMERASGSVDRVCQADIAVGEFFAEVAHEFTVQHGIQLPELDLIASSGQVTYQVIPGQRGDHDWVDRQYLSMLDLGEGGVIAARTGVMTVSSLRRKDNAVGGFGAPLVPFGDWVNFRDAHMDRVVWNIGGICNATVIPAGDDFSSVWAFDAGPGNMLIDRLAAEVTDGQLTFDRDGALAAQGAVCAQLVTESMTHPFIRQDPPKAAARQLFGDEFGADFLRRGRELALSSVDLLATATALTAEVIADAHRRFVAPRVRTAELVFSGGGALNPVLVKMISGKVAPTRVITSQAFGVPVDCREVLAMVLIANETMHGRPSNCPAATGASRPVVLGHIDVPG
jgi:anhydro-N-acetylmuramic acid kinase